MKKSMLAVTGLLLQVFVAAQLITYTRQNVAHKGGVIQLIAGIGGMNHLIQWRSSNAASIAIYDQNLRFISGADLPFGVEEESYVRVLRFNGFYYLYYYQPGGKSYGLWKITAAGEATNMKEQFINLVKTSFDSKNAMNYEMTVVGQSLYITSLVFYPSLGKAMAVQIRTDSLLQPNRSYKLTFDFDKSHQRIHRVIQADDKRLILLKTAVDSNARNVLEVLSFNMIDSVITSCPFNIGSKFFLNPNMSYSSVDSSVTVYSLARDRYYPTNLKYMFTAKINLSLPDVKPAAVMRPTYVSSFMMADGPSPQWLPFNSTYLFARPQRRAVYLQDFDRYDATDPDLLRQFSRSLPPAYYTIDNQPVKFFRVAENFRLIKDSVVKNDRNNYSLLADEYGQFRMNGNSYLVLRQRFRKASEGLVILGRGKGAGFSSVDLHVYDRYDCQLSQLQQLKDDTLVMPFVYNRDAGIIKIRLDPNSTMWE